MNGDKYDTIVVGGGIAGLTSTAFLAREGQKVLLIEKNKDTHKPRQIGVAVGSD